MAEPFLTVVAEITAKPGREEELRSVLTSVVPLVRAEEGCVQYDLHVNTKDPASFLFYETWKDADALKCHAGSAHMRAFGAKAADLVSGPARILTYTKIS
jgi:quinol monooxygenase YgiN